MAVKHERQKNTINQNALIRTVKDKILVELTIA